jgi:hypothetical protein
LLIGGAGGMAVSRGGGGGGTAVGGAGGGGGGITFVSGFDMLANSFFSFRIDGFLTNILLDQKFVL